MMEYQTKTQIEEFIRLGKSFERNAPVFLKFTKIKWVINRSKRHH